jgi:hypothetical protein
MPQVMNQTEVDAYAHCGTPPVCDGYDQVKVKAIREELGTTYMESGGDLPFIEKSHIHLRFADPDDAACPHCGAGRELSEQPRTTYQNLSGYDPEGLRGIKYGVDK